LLAAEQGTMKELSLLENQHICTLNTCGYIAHIREVLGEEAVPLLFKDIFDHNGYAIDRTYLGQPIGIDYFLQPDNWFDNELSLKFFSNVNDLGVDLVETGKVTVRNNLMQKNGVVLGLAQVVNMDKTFKGVNRVNALFNRTKTVGISGLSERGALLRLNYNPGFRHTEFVTQQNIGAYIAVLEFFGYREVTYRILTDECVGNSGCPGKTEIAFRWKPKGLWERIQFLLASLVSKRLMAPYLRSSRYIHDFHSTLVKDYQFQLSRKNQVLQELESRYRDELRAKDDVIASKNQLIQKQEQQLSERYLDFINVLEQWVTDCDVRKLSSVTEAAKAMNVTEKTLNRRIDAAYQKTAKQFLSEKLIERSKAMLEQHSIDEVADKCGYASTSSYSRAFKRVTDFSPSEYVEADRVSDSYENGQNV